MASFAKIGLNGKVIEVLSVHNNVLKDADGVEQEINGIDFLTKLTGWAIWKQTSYNTSEGVHKLGSIPLRKNFASIGMIYDENRDAFIHSKPFNSWILNEDTCIWEAPVAKPQDDNIYSWNESTLTWDIVEV